MLQFLSQSYEEECKKNLSLIPEKVSKGLLDARPDIVEGVFKEYMDYFVKAERVGLKNVDKVHFTSSETMPARMKPPVRPLPAAIQEAALAEFTRMCTYMFIKSNSPIASHLTTA